MGEMGVAHPPKSSAQVVRWWSRTKLYSRSPTDCRKGGPRHSPSGKEKTTVSVGREGRLSGEQWATGAVPGQVPRQYLNAGFGQFYPTNELDYDHGDAWWACIQWRDLGVALLSTLEVPEGEVDPPSIPEMVADLNLFGLNEKEVLKKKVVVNGPAPRASVTAACRNRSFPQLPLLLGIWGWMFSGDRGETRSSKEGWEPSRRRW